MTPIAGVNQGLLDTPVMPERSAIVTGAAGGIGRAITERLLADGYGVLAVDLKPDPDGPGEPYAADLTTREGNRGAVDAALEAFGRLDAVIPNAGFQHVAPIDEFPEDRWDGLIALLLTSPFLLARYAWEHLAKSGDGRYVAIASAHALAASPYKAGYVSAKHGVLGLVRTLALEGAEQGILATAVCPGFVRTPLVEGQLADQAKRHGVSEETVLEDVILAPHAVKRLIEPEEVAERRRVPARPRRALVHRRPGDDGPGLDRSVSAFEAIVLGIVQGLTEFLPISSTAHLRIVPAFAGWEDPGAAFTAVTQLGTMAAVLLYFRHDLWRIAVATLRALTNREARQDHDARLGFYIIIGTIPIGIFGLVFKDQIENGARNLTLIGCTLIVLGLLLLVAEKVATPRAHDRLAQRPRRRDHRHRAGVRAGAGRVALGRDADRRHVPGLQAHRRRPLLVPALGPGGRPLGRVRAAPHRRGQRRRSGADRDRDALRLRRRLRVDRLPAALPRQPLDGALRRLSRGTWRRSSSRSWRPARSASFARCRALSQRRSLPPSCLPCPLPRSPTTSPAPRSTWCPRASGEACRSQPAADSQAKLYDSLTPRFDQVTADDLTRSFKSEAFGVGPDGPATTESVPRAGVRILRDRFNVPHINGSSRDDITWAMGWVLQEDRGLLLAQGRYPARLAAIDAPNINAFGLVTGLKSYTPTPEVDRMINRNSMRALRSVGEDGKRLLHDVDVFIQGVNARLRAEKSTAKPFTRVDIFAVNALVGQIFGEGGGGEASRSQFLGALRKRLGSNKGDRLFDDLSEHRDADTPATINRTFDYAKVPKDRPGSVILAPGSLKPVKTAGASATAATATPRWASNFLILGKERSTHGPSAVRGRPADRLLLPRPHARGRHQLARRPGARRLLAGQPRDRSSSAAGRTSPGASPRRGRTSSTSTSRCCAAARRRSTSTRASAARWARSTPARSRARAGSSTARPSTAR